MVKTKDKSRSNGKVKVKRVPELPEKNEYDFGADEYVEAAEEFYTHLKDLHNLDENDGYQAVLEFARWARDTVGWKKFGRIIMKGSAAR
jgi:hypothetical protein